MSKNIITVTEKALTQLHKIINRTEYNFFNLSLKSGGCSGFEYNLLPIKDTSTKYKNYEIFKKNDVEIKICDKSLMFLIGTEIDWQEDIISKKFVFNNPLAKAKCGCGTSFSPYDK